MKTIDDLIRENPNLNSGIYILIKGLIELGGSKYLSAWDEYRMLDALKAGGQNGKQP